MQDQLHAHFPHQKVVDRSVIIPKGTGYIMHESSFQNQLNYYIAFRI